MTELVFDKKVVFKLNWFGSSYELTKPTVKQTIDYQRKVTKLTDDIEKFEAMIDFLHGLGLKKEVSESMDMEQLLTVVQSIMPQDKKK